MANYRPPCGACGDRIPKNPRQKSGRLRKPTASLVAQLVKTLPARWKMWVWSLGWKDPLKEGTATQSIFWPEKSPWTEEPGGLQSIGSQSRIQLRQHSTHTRKEACMGEPLTIHTWSSSDQILNYQLLEKQNVVLKKNLGNYCINFENLENETLT